MSPEIFTGYLLLLSTLSCATRQFWRRENLGLDRGRRWSVPPTRQCGLLSRTHLLPQVLYLAAKFFDLALRLGKLRPCLLQVALHAHDVGRCGDSCDTAASGIRHTQAAMSTAPTCIPE
jgi:hypothetical protein